MVATIQTRSIKNTFAKMKKLNLKHTCKCKSIEIKDISTLINWSNYILL